MNKEIRERWVAALRSGEYKQIRGKLRTKEGFCCLGVLCDVQGVTWVEGEEQFYIDTNGTLGSRVTNGIYLAARYSPKSGTHLVNMNDIQDKTFEEIADWIEYYE